MTETNVQDQVAIVTGGGQGIGRAIALRLARDGMHVVIADREAETAHAVASEIEALGRQGLAIPIDVSKAEGRELLITETLARLHRLDVLINNAGIQRVALPQDVDEAHWDIMMNINAKAVYFLCQLALKHMASTRSGRIVNIASMAGKLANTVQHPIYNVSKAAVLAMTKTLAQAYAQQGIRVNAVCPGIIETPMQELVDREFSRVTGKQPQEIRAERMARIPMARVGEGDDVAAVVSFLAGPDSSYMTGQALNVTGGLLTF